MGALFRSEDMTLLQLFIQPEAAYHIVAALGESGCVQFRDLNGESNLFQREFSGEIKRVGEMERQLGYIEAEINKSDIRIHDISDVPKAPNPREIVNLEAHLEKTEHDIRELSDGANQLKKEYYERVQQKYVLLKAQTFFNQQEEATHQEFTPDEMRNASQLGFIAGVINKDKIFTFERILWRIGRGNIFLRQSDIDELITDPITGTEARKAAFIAFFQGENLGTKIEKVCAGFKVHLVKVPVTLSVRKEQVKLVSAAVEDIKNVLNQTEDHRRRLLVAVAKDIQNWSVLVCKLKAIYNTLNLFSHDLSKKCLIAECWTPTVDIVHVKEALVQGSVCCGSSVQSFYNILKTKQTPPTFNRTNKFTRGFQNLISAYAISSYRELNPALYTIITFPFLFAVMFGDLGHGLIMVSFAAWLVYAEEKISAQKNKSEIFSIFFGGRYIILLMGICSMYTGLIYNDVFSKSLNIFGSSWKINAMDLKTMVFSSNSTNKGESVGLIPLHTYDGTPYIIGMDPVWQNAENKIIFLNSFKMKLSIIFGVIHMLFGICLSVVNFIHFKKYAYIILDFLPKILFFTFLFVYLVFMIFMKWFNYSAMNDFEVAMFVSYKTEIIFPDTPHGSACAPNVLIFFIGMMLFKESELKPPCEKYMFSTQNFLQQILVLLSLVCIPWMLLGVPLYEISSRKKKNASVVRQQNGHASNHIELEAIPETTILAAHGSDEEEEEKEESVSDIMVHAGIHTIEFVLSTVSHTASYLRLWALSLAHAELSEVLWQMVLQKGLVTLSRPYLGGVAIYIVFYAWSCFTVSILVLMEGLSAFLHTLRLHWVEFMTKFFEGQGYNFVPFSFKNILDEGEAEETS